MNYGCPICAKGGNIVHGCVSPRTTPFDFSPRPLIPFKPYPYRIPINPSGSYTYSIGSVEEKNMNTETIEANVNGVYIKIPKTKKAIALAKEVIKMLEKQV